MLTLKSVVVVLYLAAHGTAANDGGAYEQLPLTISSRELIQHDLGDTCKLTQQQQLLLVPETGQMRSRKPGPWSAR